MNCQSIAIFTWGFDGGAFTNLPIALAQGFRHWGVSDVYLLYLHHAPAPDLVIPEGVKLVPLNVKRSVFCPLALAQWLRQVQPDVLITMPTIVSIPAILGHLLAQTQRTKLVIYQGDTLTSDVAIDHKHDLRMQIMPALARLLYPWADGLTTVSEGVLSILEQDRIPIPQNCHAIIPNPVDIREFKSQSLQEPDHPWLQHKQAPTIISLGRLVKRKNYPLLLQAFALLKHRMDARLIIMGEGPEREALEQKIAQLELTDSVSLPGHVANPWSNIAQADVFVMSSLDEAFCLALVEAMACGVPVISTDAIGGGPRSILKDGKYGNLVPINDPVALTDAIYRTLTSQDWRNQLIEVSQQRAADFQPESIAQQWLTFLQQVPA